MRRTVDAVERIVMLLLFLWLLYRFRISVQHNELTVVYLIGDGLVVLMLLLRRATDQITVKPRDWFFAFMGTFASLLVSPGQRIDVLAPLVVILLFGGLAISILAKLTLNRSFGLVAANRGVKTAGVYGIVRHPMYLGYFLSTAAMLMLNFSAWNVAVLSVWAVFQILRIESEEQVLGLDAAYRAHVGRVPYRLMPWVY